MIDNLIAKSFCRALIISLEEIPGSKIAGEDEGHILKALDKITNCFLVRLEYFTLHKKWRSFLSYSQQPTNLLIVLSLLMSWYIWSYA